MIFGSATDLGTSLWFIAIAIVILAAAGGVAAWRARRRGSTTLVLDVALTLSGWWVMLSAIGLISIVGRAFSADWMELPGAEVYVPLPHGLPCVEFGVNSADGPAIGCGAASMTGVTVYNASLGVRVMASLAELCGLVASTLPAALIGVICFQTLRGRPFHRTVTRALLVGALVLLVLGVGGGLLTEISNTLALREVFGPDSDWYPQTFQLALPLLPVGGAIGLAALAAVFSQGSRLQAERDRLERETEGLV